MTMNSNRLDGKLGGVALATILAIVVSIVCAGVSIVADSGGDVSAQAQAPSKIVASVHAAVVRR